MQLSVIDVSEHQGNINWEKVKNAGVVGAMIRTGYGIKDPNQIDKWFYNNLSGCQNVGIPYGFYHYSYATNAAGAQYVPIWQLLFATKFVQQAINLCYIQT